MEDSQHPSDTRDELPIFTEDFYRAASLLDRIRAGGGESARITDVSGASVVSYPDPTPEMLRRSDFDAVWQAIKGWDIQRERDVGYAGASGNDARHILDALAKARDMEPNSPSWNPPGAQDGPANSAPTHPVAWRVKDFADGWILCQSEAQARREAEGADNLVQPLYTTPPTPSGVAELVAEARDEAATWPREGYYGNLLRRLADALEARAGGKGAE